MRSCHAGPIIAGRHVPTLAVVAVPLPAPHAFVPVGHAVGGTAVEGVVGVLPRHVVVESLRRRRLVLGPHILGVHGAVAAGSVPLHWSHQGLKVVFVVGE